MDEISRYLDLVDEAWRSHPDYREGQAYSNVLFQEWPEIAKQLRETDLDPFTLDRKLPAYLDWVEQQLGRPAPPAGSA